MLNAVKPMTALLVVTLVASFLLGLVYTVTEEPIALQKAQTEMEAIEKIMTGTASTELVDLTAIPDAATGKNISKITKCLDEAGGLVGYVFSVTPKGYGGAIEMMVGLSGEPAGTVQGVEIISHAETPGLGANADAPEFTGQYKGKDSPLFTVVKIGPAGEDEIQAIASATITTQAVTNGVNEAQTFYIAHLMGVE